MPLTQLANVIIIAVVTIVVIVGLTIFKIWKNKRDDEREVSEMYKRRFGHYHVF